MPRSELGGHVFTVEFHVYIYHLIDVLPDYDLPKLIGGNNGFDNLKMEDLEVTIVRNDGTSTKYEQVKFPERFTDVMDFYLFDLTPIFFPSYEYHTLSKNGVVLRNAVLQASRHDTVLSLIPGLMLNVELSDIRTIKWKTPRGHSYILDLCEVAPLVNLVRPPSNSMYLPKPKAIHHAYGVDLRPLCPAIKDQGDLGTCGVAAVTTFLEFVTGTPLSILFVYYVSRVFVIGSMPHDDSGVELKDVLEALSKYGICKEESWPYDTSKFLEAPSTAAFEEASRFRPAHSKFQPLNSLEDMKATLKKEMPFFVDIDFAPAAYGRESAQTGKIAKAPTKIEYCDHTVLVVGYNDETEELIFQNSWGTHWGDKGFGYVPYQYINNNLFRNAYTWKGEKPRPF